MEKPEERAPEHTAPDKEIEEIAARAVGMHEFQNAVAEAKDKLQAIKVVRELLRQYFPEIEDLPPPKGEAGIYDSVANELIIAERIVDQLFTKGGN